jgi:hypothetical protein
VGRDRLQPSLRPAQVGAQEHQPRADVERDQGHEDEAHVVEGGKPADHDLARGDLHSLDHLHDVARQVVVAVGDALGQARAPRRVLDVGQVLGTRHREAHAAGIGLVATDVENLERLVPGRADLPLARRSGRQEDGPRAAEAGHGEQPLAGGGGEEERPPRPQRAEEAT